MREDSGDDRRDVVLPSLVHAPCKPEAALQEADRAFDAGTEGLCEVEQGIELALLLSVVASSLLGDGDDLDLSGDLLELVAGPIALVRRNAGREMSKQLLVAVQGGAYQGRLGWLVIEDLVVCDELLACLLDLDHVAEFDVLAGLAALEELRVLFKYAEQLVLVRNRAPLQHSLARLPDDVPDQRIDPLGK